MSDVTTVLGSLDAPLGVLTTVAEGERSGCVVGFHTQSSIDPVRHCVWLSKANHTYQVALRARWFVLHFLTEDDRTLAERFGGESGEDVDKFAGLQVEEGPDGVPRLPDIGSWLLGERLSILDDGGDHVCLNLDVRRVETAGVFTPLRMHDAEGIDPGRDSHRRAVDPEA